MQVLAVHGCWCLVPDQWFIPLPGIPFGFESNENDVFPFLNALFQVLLPVPHSLPQLCSLLVPCSPREPLTASWSLLLPARTLFSRGLAQYPTGLVCGYSGFLLQWAVLKGYKLEP